MIWRICLPPEGLVFASEDLVCHASPPPLGLEDLKGHHPIFKGHKNPHLYLINQKISRLGTITKLIMYFLYQN